VSGRMGLLPPRPSIIHSNISSTCEAPSGITFDM
jgi:hypothetical protein